MDILKIEMQKNDAKATTIGAYLGKLLFELWKEGEGFSGKRPFGNSDWEYELYEALVRAGAVKGEIDEYGDMQWFNEDDADEIIFETINELFAEYQ